MTSLRLTIVLLILIPSISATTFVRNPKSDLGGMDLSESFIIAYDEDIFSKLQTPLFEIAAHKPVTLEDGASCADGTYCIPFLKNSVEGDRITEEMDCENVTCEVNACSSASVNLSTADITGDSLEHLSNNQILNSTSVARERNGMRTYVLSISGRIRTANVFNLNKIVNILNLYISSTRLFNVVIKLKYLNSVNRVQLDAVLSGISRKIAEFNAYDVNQIAVMSSEVNASFSIWINGTAVYQESGVVVTYHLQRAPEVYSFSIQQWGIYNRSLTSSELVSLIPGNTQEFFPKSGMGVDCPCPAYYPLFERWPTENFDYWYGVRCSTAEKNGSVLRIPKRANIPQFVTDGFEDTFWISSTGSIASKLTIDLGATYNIFFATITLETLPKHLLITSRKNAMDRESQLILWTENCTSPISPISTDSTGPLYKCVEREVTNMFGTEMLLNWLFEVPAEDLRQDYKNGVYLARYVSFYFKDFLFGAENHVIREIRITGSCDCSGLACQVEPSRVYARETRRRKREAESFGSGIETASIKSAGLRRVKRQVQRPESGSAFISPSGYNFKTIYGYSCQCANHTAGDQCTTCAVRTFRSNGHCVPCGCSDGASEETCDADGSCVCDKAETYRPELADRQCNAFVYKVTPEVGPIAGGTQVLLRTGWFDVASHVVKVGSEGLLCEVNELSSNSTYVVCTMPEVTDPRNVTLSINELEPKVIFTYLPNPNITKIGTQMVMISGGVNVTVEGNNFQTVQKPKMVISIICKHTGVKLTSRARGCEVVSDTKMLCTAPDLSVVLSTLSCVFTNETTPTPTRRKREVDVEDTNKIFLFHYGFVLDGLEDFEDAQRVPWLGDSATLIVTKDPILKPWDDPLIHVSNPREQQLMIYGQYLNSGASLDDYTVEYGDEILNITGLMENVIACSLPLQQPRASSKLYHYDTITGEKIPAVFVAVGNISDIHIGFVKYGEPPETKESNTTPDDRRILSIVLPIVICFIVLIIVLVVVLICCRRKQQAKMTGKQDYKKAPRYVAGPHGQIIIMDKSYMDSEHMDMLKPWIIPDENLSIGTALGQGQFGKVFMGSLLMKSGARRQVAVKSLKTELVMTDPQAFSNFLQEAVLMKDFNHPNVLSLIGLALNDEDVPMVILPYMAKGDLKQVLKDEKMEYTVGDLMHFALQVSIGMDYLQKRKFIHRDLAARNCMVNDTYMVKIADFGLSHDIYAQDYYRVQDRAKPLPVKWMAIESLVSGKYTTESDVWSFGVVVWEILTRGASPYPGVANYEIKSHLMIGQTLQKPDYCPDEVYEIMSACWEHDASSRPTFETISELLGRFLSDDDYTREQTRDISDDYYLEDAEVDDVPVFVNDPKDGVDNLGVDEPYDVPAPVCSSAIGSDSSTPVSPTLDPNSNNSNNSQMEGNPEFEVNVHPGTTMKRAVSSDYSRALSVHISDQEEAADETDGDSATGAAMKDLSGTDVESGYMKFLTINS